MSTIRMVEYADLSSIKKLTDEGIGKDFYKMEDLQKIYEADHKFIYVNVNEEQEVTAYLYLFVSTLEEALEVLNIPYGKSGLSDRNPKSCAGVYKTTCTRAQDRNQGVLTSFLEQLEEELWKRGAEFILAPALKTPAGKIPVQSHLHAVGFREITDVKHPWIHIDSYCPYCRAQNCRCDCVLYMKERG